MIVIKKSGRKEDFSSQKLASSIRSANQKTDETVDVNSLVYDFDRIVSGKDLITTKQIDIIVYGLLYALGHLQTLIAFVSYDKKDKL